MADRQFTFSVLLRGVDFGLTPLLRRASAGINDVDAAARRARSLKVLAGDLRSVGEGMQRAGAMAVAAGAGLGLALGLTDVPRQAIAAEHALLAVANTAGLSSEQVRHAHLSLRSLSRDANQLQADLISGLGVLTAAGLTFGESMGALPAIARTATAETAAIADLANTSFALIGNMRLEVRHLATTLDQLATAGHAGQFELRDMAQHFPALTASASNLGLHGAPSILSLAAALQIARRGAGDAATAANNFKNFLDKLGSPEVQRNFQKLGVSVKQEFVGALQRGEDPILHMVQLVQRLTGGDAFRLGELFQDIQVQSFLKPMLASIADFQRIKAEAARGGVVDQDFERIMKSVAEQSKALRINMAATAMPLAEGSLAAMNRLLVSINSSSTLRGLALAGTVFLGVFGAGALAIGTMTRAAGVWFSAGSTALRVLSAFRGGMIGMQTVWAADQVMQMRSARVGAFVAATWARMGAGLLWLRGAALAGATGLRVAAVATWTFTAALLANPITWVVLGVTALAGAAFLLVRNWRHVSAFFAGLWADLRDAGANIFRSIWVGMQSMVSKPIELMRWMAGKLRALLPFSPAKEGPLRDLHRVRIVETIAAMMQPSPMVNAMRRAAALTAAAAVIPGAALLSASASAAPRDGIARLERADTRRSAVGAGAVVFTYAPVVQVAAGTPAQNVAAMRRTLDRDRAELERLVREVIRRERAQGELESYS